MTNTSSLLLAPEWLLTGPDAGTPRKAHGVLVRRDRIAAIAPLPQLLNDHPEAQRIYLPDCLLMAGMVNAHQHGRGLSQIQLGYHDTFLEAWIASRRGKGILDPYAITHLAALEMLANGVTCAIHANYTYGTGDYEHEVREQLRAYDDAGLRVTMCVGYQDQGALVYPPHEACHLHGLPQALRDWLSRPGAKPYAGSVQDTIALMHRLLADYADHPRIRLCYGPGGPQWVSDDAWRQLARDANEHALAIHTHALESPAQVRAARDLYPGGVFQHLDALGALGPRTILAHGVWIEEKDMPLLAERGVSIVRNPGCNLRMHNGIAPLARFLKHGLTVAIGSDNVTLQDDEDLLSELRLADQLAREPDWQGAPPASVEQLLAMLTSNGAHAAQWGGDTGRISPGLAADLVAIDLTRARTPMLDDDMPLLRAMLSRSRGDDVRMTMVDGRIRYLQGRHTDADIDQARAAAVACAEAARTQVDQLRREKARETVEHLCQHYRSRA
ncbi:amidohydrolase family protein [Paracandidimonas soli]|uniref:Cytosine/adenosine deaminase-related metal-dependent hydrolase n=1 Tax=Paracandidimonas soli TaxID=1917182 RepID=A0A4R3VCP2_9BURK|nr:amidohydrolase family protein [Paracandidimonas soli]TCV03097.1 cytosine/adenosine deaminase-related metal-dependent hydrolase [Paracandidimonas soli]